MRINPRFHETGTALNVVGPDITYFAPQPHYENIELQAGSSALMEFETRRGRKKKTYKHAVMSFEANSISADKIVVDSNRQIISAIGRVIVVHGTRLDKFVHVEIPYSDFMK